MENLTAVKQVYQEIRSVKSEMIKTIVRKISAANEELGQTLRSVTRNGARWEEQMENA